MVPSASSAPSVMLPSVRMTGSTRLPSGMRATLLNKKIADSRERKKSLAPAKKKFPACSEALNLDQYCRAKFCQLQPKVQANIRSPLGPRLSVALQTQIEV